MQQLPITTLFLDIGGVILSNGWDRSSRSRAAKHFNIDYAEMDERHHLCFDSYERGKIDMNEYLSMVVFHEKRSFTSDDFKSFIYSQSEILPGHFDFFKSLKEKHQLKVLAVNNEAREINDYRINKFKLHELFDAFISSCYVGLRKPDTDIYHTACDLARIKPQQSLFIDDRKMFVEIAEKIGFNTIVFDTLDHVQEKIRALKFAYGTLRNINERPGYK